MSPYLELDGNPKIERKGTRSDDGKLDYRIQVETVRCLRAEGDFPKQSPVPDIFSTTQWI
jgi:hypothetical protein